MYALNLNLEVFKILKAQSNGQKKDMYAQNLNLEVFKFLKSQSNRKKRHVYSKFEPLRF